MHLEPLLRLLLGVLLLLLLLLLLPLPLPVLPSWSSHLGGTQAQR